MRPLASSPPCVQSFPGHGWFRGEIISINEGVYQVEYDDGDIESYNEPKVKVLIGSSAVPYSARR